MSRFEVVEGKAHHAGVVIRRLRAGDLAAMQAVGISRAMAHVELRRLFDASSFRKTWLIDGEVSAIGGVTGALLSGSGYIWLVLTENALRFPLEIIKEARRQIAQMMKTRTELTTTVLTGDETALRFSAFLGFRIDGAHGIDRRAQLRLFSEHPEMHIPFGTGFIVPLGYRAEAA